MVGLMLCSSPFLGMFVLIGIGDSWKTAFAVFGAVIALLAVIGLGSYLLCLP